MDGVADRCSDIIERVTQSINYGARDLRYGENGGELFRLIKSF